jgi:RNA polymerase sigma factor (sigma-70 family)
LLQKALYQYNSLTLIDNRPGSAAISSEAEYHQNLTACAADFNALYARCAQAWPSFVVPRDEFTGAVVRAIDKYLIGFARSKGTPSISEIRVFIGELQSPDIYLSLGCALGDENAWWQFDRNHRAFIEALANQVVSSGIDANQVIESVYGDLLGAKTESSVRQSKFRTYMGRGTLRGWLRTIIWHTSVDLRRSRQPEVPLEDWSGTGDEALDRKDYTAGADGCEDLMLSKVMRERYRSATVEALDRSLASLDDHETLLLLYYHVEGLKLRQIARIVEQPRSAIRRWFQRQSRRQTNAGKGRVHESTVMRWLDKVYRKISDAFQSELANKHGLSPAEIEICLDLATEDLAQNVKLNRVPGTEEIIKRGEAG